MDRLDPSSESKQANIDDKQSSKKETAHDETITRVALPRVSNPSAQKRDADHTITLNPTNGTNCSSQARKMLIPSAEDTSLTSWNITAH